AWEETCQRLRYFAKEGEAGVDRTFRTHTGAPLAVLDGVGNQRPVQAVNKRRAEECQAGERHKADRAAAEEIVEQIAQHPNQQAADIDLLLTKTSDCARHQEHADENTAHAEK